MSRTSSRPSGPRGRAHRGGYEQHRVQEAARRRARVRRRGRWCLAFAILAGFVALCMPFAVRSDYLEETSFDRAVPCAPDAPVSFTDCLSRATEVVVSKREVVGKNAHEFVTVDFGGTSPTEIGFTSRDFWSRLSVGEQIGVTVWRERFVRLDDSVGTTNTDDSPVGNTQMTATLALPLLGLALWLGYLSFWYLRRTERTAAIPAPPALILPARAVGAGVIPALVALVTLASTRGSLSPAAALLVVPLSYAAVLLLAASSLLSSRMRRPGEVHFKH
ncbi:hypothetical protein ABH931_003627 [Streptacidiphilus sp. MAP12-33]|uniref:hypothetical protein n=1 Tax=Streptacidiphilus sp. MAP12-33 TaxID=3156266 RepID=UPI0035119BBC